MHVVRPIFNGRSIFSTSLNTLPNIRHSVAWHVKVIDEHYGLIFNSCNSHATLNFAAFLKFMNWAVWIEEKNYRSTKPKFHYSLIFTINKQKEIFFNVTAGYNEKFCWLLKLHFYENVNIRPGHFEFFITNTPIELLLQKQHFFCAFTKTLLFQRKRFIYLANNEIQLLG